jgi:hypothetical protein
MYWMSTYLGSRASRPHLKTRTPNLNQSKNLFNALKPDLHEQQKSDRLLLSDRQR